MVHLGRRDSTTANLGQANSDLPSFRASLGDLISNFDRKGLSARDMVAVIISHKPKQKTQANRFQICKTETSKTM